MIFRLDVELEGLVLGVGLGLVAMVDEVGDTVSASAGAR